ncbi:MAG: hypothetical protein H6907_03440 [Hyphomicrobiales bacterium]|nr:hypothetical protein [Hyphomicrobiales bacterium]
MLVGGAIPRAVSVGEIRILTYDKETSTSDCIGDPRTPICGVETVEACRDWSDKDLCDIAEFDFSALRGLAPGPLGSLTVHHLHILADQILGDADIPDWARHLARDRNQLPSEYPAWLKRRLTQDWRPGDARVTIKWLYCGPEDACIDETIGHPTRRLGEGCPAERCVWDDTPKTYVLRRKGTKWVVIYIQTDPPPDYGALRKW